MMKLSQRLLVYAIIFGFGSVGVSLVIWMLLMIWRAILGT